MRYLSPHDLNRSGRNQVFNFEENYMSVDGLWPKERGPFARRLRLKLSPHKMENISAVPHTQPSTPSTRKSELSDFGTLRKPHYTGECPTPLCQGVMASPRFQVQEPECKNCKIVWQDFKLRSSKRGNRWSRRCTRLCICQQGC